MIRELEIMLERAAFLKERKETIKEPLKPQNNSNRDWKEFLFTPPKKRTKHLKFN